MAAAGHAHLRPGQDVAADRTAGLAQSGLSGSKRASFGARRSRSTVIARRKARSTPTGAGGWLKDRFGLSWQVDHAGLQDMMSDTHPDRADRVTKAMFTMKKIDIQRLKDAYEGR
ncbi:MAG: hypothetical protein GEV13_23310 [Rhodospirillales bacterium]|nr:hypothetical protein [Rhodospirillales bacterium]